ncbi:MAG: lipid II flippase MurJ [Pseudomonadota bacterium]
MGAVLRLSLLLSIALMLGRASGLVRDVVLAARFGVSDQADLAVTLLTLPDIVVGLLLTGGFTAALVPAFRLMGSQARPLLMRTLVWVGLGFSLLALVVASFPGVVLGLLSPSTPFMFLRTAAFHLQVTTLALPLAALAGVLLAFANARERFFAPGLGTLVFNLSVIAALLLLARGTLAFWPVVAGIVAGAFARVLLVGWMAATAPGEGARAGVVPPGLAKRFVFGILATGLLVAMPILFRSLTAAQAGGALSAFAYALKLFELPTALVFAPLATVLLPRLTGLYATNAQNHGPLPQALAASLLVSCVAVVLGWVFGADLVRIIFGYGAMTAQGLAQITVFGQVMFLALPGAGVALICAAGLNAQGRVARVLAGTGLAAALALAVAAYGSPLWGFVVFYTACGLAHALALGLRPPMPSRAALLRALAFALAALLVWGLSWATLGQSPWLRAALCLPAAGLLFAPYLGIVLKIRRIASGPATL